MQKEYKILEVKLGEAEARMNDMAKHGWEVASTDIYLGGIAHTKAGTPMLIISAVALNICKSGTGKIRKIAIPNNIIEQAITVLSRMVARIRFLFLAPKPTRDIGEIIKFILDF